MKIFDKILIANRGEIAVRVIRACREMGIKTVAVYSEIDKESIPVKIADEAVCIGPASPLQSYLNIPAILSAAEITGAEAIHPGYGFLAENAQFVEACKSSGITFIGPTAENIRLGGDKSKARQMMKRKGIPVVPGSDGPVDSAEAARKAARKLEFPVMLKASMGGGGRGMKIVNDESELEDAFYKAQREAFTAFGSDELYLEQYIPSIRHIEVQILADNKGNVVHLGERECSIQRRHQKLIEEAPSSFVNEKLRKKLGDLAVKAAQAIRYRNVGTVEFIVDQKMRVFFMELNTRIQVEHPITEAVTGIDLIKEQIRLAAGAPLDLKQSSIRMDGCAIECRVNAEDPVRFIPSAGFISLFYPPGGQDIRVDTAAFSGWRVPSEYDSLIAKLVVHGKDRKEAIEKMKAALGLFVIEGIKTTIPFHKRVLEHEAFLSGDFDTSFIERMNGTGKPEKGE